jgi:uncharacterized protein
MHVIIFAKAPIPGTVKTRMIPALGEMGAAMLHMALVERAIENVARHCDSVELCCAPDASDPYFASLVDDFANADEDDTETEIEISLTAQGDGDLGERMLRALDRALKHDSHAAILGADCPSVSAKDIANAEAALANHDVVLIPAEDGGYVFIAAKRVAATMFDNIVWGTSQVLVQQRAALTRAGLNWCELDTRWDVDEPADLARLKTLKPPLSFFL